jgi:hypothetical protein
MWGGVSTCSFSMNFTLSMELTTVAGMRKKGIHKYKYWREFEVVIIGE